MISKNEAANRKLSGFDGGISRVKWASIYQCDCGAGFRLSPTCSPIRYGLVFPRGCLFFGIVHDKGRYRQHPITPGVIRRIGRVLARIARKRWVAHSPRETLLEPKSSGTAGSQRPQRERGSSECEVDNAPELGGAFQYHRPCGNGTHGESSRRPLTL